MAWLSSRDYQRSPEHDSTLCLMQIMSGTQLFCCVSLYDFPCNVCLIFKKKTEIESMEVVPMKRIIFKIKY